MSRRERALASALPVLTVVALLTAAAPAAADGVARNTLARGPYLQQTRGTSTYVVWQTDQPLPGAVHYGRQTTGEHVRQVPHRRRLHAVKLRGLSPATGYRYRVSAGGRTTRSFHFTTAPVGAEPFRFGVIGDYGSGRPPAYRNAALLRTEGVDLLLSAGDNVYPRGLEREYDRGLFRPFRSLMSRVAIWPTLGNHDYGIEQGAPPRRTADAYFHNFVLPADPGRERFYSFRYGNAEFLAIDSEVTSFAPASRQYRWIDATLRRARACWTIPYFHHPAHAEYVNPSAGDITKLRHIQRWLVPLFERHGVKLVLTAHEHNYVRSRPLIGGREDPSGVTYVLAGGGGGELERLPPTPSTLTAARGRFFHHLLVSVAGTKLRARAIDTGGRVRDRFNLSCRA